MEIIFLKIVMAMGLLHFPFFLSFYMSTIHEEQCYDCFFHLGPWSILKENPKAGIH